MIPYNTCRQPSSARAVGLALGLLLLWPQALVAQIEVQLFLGASVSAPSPLSIEQRQQPDLRFTAHWATRPFQDALYYAARVGLWQGSRGWAFDFTHHKIYLTNPPAAVQQFRITNGLNLLTVSRTFRRGEFSFGLGAGPVVTFPRTRIRDQRLEEGRGFWGGYFLSGGHLMASATRRFPLSGRLFFSLDGRASATYLRLPVGNGHASVPNFALHFHGGLGYGPNPRPKKAPTR
jgi:hypothetical protein